MKKITLYFTAIFFLTASVKLMAQDANEMKAWMIYMTPGDVHKMLASSDGEWNEDITIWMAPGAPPMKTAATASNKMILGGRYQQSNTTGSFNGMPYEGMQLLGYDNAKKIFISSWVDNMGTGIMQMTGPWDDKTKTINFTGTETDPMTGKDINVRANFKLIDKNTQLMEMFTIKDGKESKTMEIKFTRK